MAATIVDALLVTLGLDATNFKKGAKETDAALDKTSGRVSKTSKDMEAWGKNAAAGMSKLRNEVLGLLAVFTAGVGIKNFVENTISSTASLGRLSQNLDMSAKDLAMWQLANKNAGGSVEGMTAQLQEAQKAISDYRLGKTNAANVAFRATGLSKESDFKDAETLLRARSDAIAKIISTHGVGVGRSIAADIGISEDTFNLLKQGAVQVDRLRFAQEKLADAQARASGPAEEFRKKLDTLKNKFEAIGVRILTALMPQLDRFADWLDKNQGKIEKWADEAVKAIEDFVKWADKAADSVGGWKNVLLALVAIKVLTMVSPLLSLAAALVQVGSALGVIGGASGTGALAVLGKLARVGGVGAALLFHTDELNAGEDAELAKRRALGDADFAKRGIGPDGKPLNSSSLPRGMRNNNPGNIEYGDFAKKHGATGSDGRFAIFPTMEAGQAAQRALLNGYLSSGANTVSKAISKWAPSNENNTSAYISDVAKQMGVSPDQTLDSSHVEALADAISRHENGAAWSRRNELAVANVLPTLAQASNTRAAGNTTSTSTSEVNINGPINIYTQGTDADSIAQDFVPAVKKQFASQSNTGLA